MQEVQVQEVQVAQAGQEVQVQEVQVQEVQVAQAGQEGRAAQDADGIQERMDAMVLLQPGLYPTIVCPHV